MRTEAGRLSRSNEAKRSEEALAVEAATWRRRQLDPSLTPDEARKPEHGSVIARWLADWQRMAKRSPDGQHPNMFTQLHYDTALRYHELYSQWMAVIAARNPRSSSDFGGPAGVDGRDPFLPTLAKRHAAIEHAFKDARRTVLESTPFGMMAMEAIVIENQPVEHLRGDLRLALNRLAILWKLMSQAA